MPETISKTVLLSDPKIAVNTRCLLGEGIIWDAGRNSLWWVDIEGRQIYQYAPEMGHVRQYSVSRCPTSLALTTGEKLLLTTEDAINLFDPITGDAAPLLAIEHPGPSIRLNDGACDRNGNFWAGSMCEMPGQDCALLYKFGKDGELQVCMGGVGISNGIAFSPDGRTLYFADSAKPEMFVAPLHNEGQELPAGLMPFTKASVPGVPDGATVDRDGYLWSARWDGWCLARFAPDGALDCTVALPVQRPTKCAFGGPNLSSLYITTARTGLTDAELKAQPLAGSVLVVEMGVQGVEETPFQGRLRSNCL